MTEFLKRHWPHVVSLLLAAAFIFYAFGCEPKAPSPLDPSKKMTRAELQVQLKYIVAQFDLGFADIENQEAIRTFILQNALAIGQAGTTSPLSILTTIAAFYGVASAGTAGVKAVKKVGPIPKSPSA